MNSKALLPTLTVAIATIDHRVFSVHEMLPPPQADTDILVVVQLSSHGPDQKDVDEYLRSSVTRPDVKALVMPGVSGVAKSRNLAIESADSDLLLFTDDDISVDCDGWRELRLRFAEMPDISFACARLKDPDGHWRKRYGPDLVRPARLSNTMKVGTPELAVRLADVRRKNVRFDCRFGAGTPQYVGDEYIFVADCLKEGLKGVHVPLCLGSHPKESSGTEFTPKSLTARSAVFTRVFPRSALIVRIAFAIKHRKKFRSWREGLHFVVKA